MGQRLCSIRVEIDPQTDLTFDSWAKREGRSKRRHAAILLKNLTALARTHRDKLEELGLLAKRPHGNPSN